MARTTLLQQRSDELLRQLWAERDGDGNLVIGVLELGSGRELEYGITVAAQDSERLCRGLGGTGDPERLLLAGFRSHRYRDLNDVRQRIATAGITVQSWERTGG